MATSQQSKLTCDIMNLIGVPFEYGGRGPDKYDCWGLLMEMHRRAFGVEIPDYQSPKIIPEIARLMGRDRHLWRPIEPRPGASILFKIFGVGAHVGMQIDSLKFIHTWEESGGVLVERVSDWNRYGKIIGFYEFVGSRND